MTFKDIKAYFDNIHWPQAVLLSVFVVCAFGAPTLFLLMVKAEVLSILVGLPWLTILGPGLSALLAAIAAIAGFFGHPLLRGRGQAPVVVETRVAETTKVEVERDDTHEVR